MKNDRTIAIWGYGKPLMSVIPSILADGLNVAYVRFDRMREDAAMWIEKIESEGIKVYSDDYPRKKVDLVFVINYNKIVTETELKENVFLNYHVGLLPQWRGNSANGWAVINGENQVGYTLHRLIPMLDAGDIYYQFAYRYAPSETYYDARQAMDEDFQRNLCRVIRSTIDNPERYAKKNDGDFVYCSKFRPSDGDVSGWQFTTDELIRRQYVFSPPLGTGLKFTAKGRTYEIRKMSKIEGFAESRGVAGGVVYIKENSLWVKTLDTAISLDTLVCEGDVVDCNTHFVIGQRL